MSDDRLTGWIVVCGIVLTCGITVALSCRVPVRRPTGGPDVGTRQMFYTIEPALMGYYAEQNAFPPGPSPTMFKCLSEARYLCPHQTRPVGVDRWGRPLVYYRRSDLDGQPGFFLYSRGANGRDEKGRGDDICTAKALGPSGEWKDWSEPPPWFNEEEPQ